MASSRDKLFDRITSLTEDTIKMQGFLTDHDVNKIWSDAARKRFISLNILGFPEPATQRPFLEKRLKIVLILIDIRFRAWAIGPYHPLNKLMDMNLPLEQHDLDFIKAPFERDRFRARQLYYNPKIIIERHKIQKFAEQDKLPFHKASKRLIGEGMSGGCEGVFEESIPAGYYQDLNGNLNKTTKIVARKVFGNANYHDDIRKTEIQNLIKFNTSLDSHDCIMKSLAILSVVTDGKEKFSIIMDKADKDLWHFLLPQEADKISNTHSLLDLLSEAAELAGALDWLHSRIQVTGEHLACCHMDLKPSNVLLFGIGAKELPVGRWKIADFGISAIRTPKEDMREDSDSQYFQKTMETIVTEAKRNPGPYTAPEIFVSPKKVGRNVDIWSFGCILVDVIASRMRDKASLRELIKSRGLVEKYSHSNDWFYRDGALNSAVQAWMNALETSSSLEDLTQSTALRECRQLLQEILIIEPQRPVAGNIRLRLLEICRSIPRLGGASIQKSNESESEDETPQTINLSVFKESHQLTQHSMPPLLDQRASADSFLLNKIRDWILARELEVLWINEPLVIGGRAVSPLCSGLFYAAKKEGIAVMAYFCRRTQKTKSEMLVDLTHSLIYQLQTHLKEASAPLQPIHQERLSALNGTVTLTDEISVLADLWGAMNSHWFCILDGFHVLEDGADTTLVKHLQDLLRVLCPPLKDSAAGGPRKSQTLITTSGQSLFLGKLPPNSQLDSQFFTSKVQRPIYKDLGSATEKLVKSSTFG